MIALERGQVMQDRDRARFIDYAILPGTFGSPLS